MFLIWKPSLHRLRLTPQLAVCQASITRACLALFEMNKSQDSTFFFCSESDMMGSKDNTREDSVFGVFVCFLLFACTWMTKHVTLLQLGRGPFCPPELLQPQRFSKAKVAPQTVDVWSQPKSRFHLNNKTKCHTGTHLILQICS